MTRDEIVRLAREAGCVKEEWAEVNCRFLDRFAALVASTARLEGWKAAREMAANVCADRSHKVLSCQVGEPHDLTNVFLRHHAAAANDLASEVRAMQPPAEWASPNPFPLSADETKLSMDSLRANAQPTWPHPDGFAGGLTEKSE